tara:strand:- start:3795 stop:4772 length:978 start_codon:yes stop_codon:yes gene_type:complete
MATNNTNTFTNHTGNGTEVNFAISFSYISILGIDVTVNEVLQTINTDYSINGQTLTFTNAPANGTAIRFQRNTDISLPVVDFQDGSVLTELDLDTGLRQVLFAQQENSDDAAAGIVPDGNDLTANNKRIKLINDPVDAKDSANKQYVDGFVKRDGSLPLQGDLNLAGNKISGLGNGVAATDAATKGQLDAGIANANTAIGQASASAAAAASSATQAAASATQAAASAVTANNAASTATNLARTSVFVGFQRLESGMLRMVYNLANDPNTTVYKANDFVQNGASHAYFLGEDVLSSVAPNAPKFTLAINSPANIAAGLQGHLVLDI